MCWSRALARVLESLWPRGSLAMGIESQCWRATEIGLLPWPRRFQSGWSRCPAMSPILTKVNVAFDETERRLGPLDCVVFNAGTYRRGSILDIAPNDFEHCWRVGAFAGFLIGQAAARRMVARGSGTILFTRATASLRGGANFANLASPKFALRAVAQSMARELGPPWHSCRSHHHRRSDRRNRGG